MTYIFDSKTDGNPIGPVVTMTVLHSNGGAENNVVVFDGGTPIGRVEEDGLVYEGYEDGNVVGRVEEHGIVYDLLESTVGRVDNDGLIFDSLSGDKVVGRIEGDEMLGAAVYLLLVLNR